MSLGSSLCSVLSLRSQVPWFSLASPPLLVRSGAGFRRLLLSGVLDLAVRCCRFAPALPCSCLGGWVPLLYTSRFCLLLCSSCWLFGAALLPRACAIDHFSLSFGIVFLALSISVVRSWVFSPLADCFCSLLLSRSSGFSFAAWFAICCLLVDSARFSFSALGLQILAVLCCSCRSAFVSELCGFAVWCSVQFLASRLDSTVLFSLCDSALVLSSVCQLFCEFLLCSCTVLLNALSEFSFDRLCLLGGLLLASLLCFVLWVVVSVRVDCFGSAYRFFFGADFSFSMSSCVRVLLVLGVDFLVQLDPVFSCCCTGLVFL